MIGRQLRFHKVGRDGTAKADAFYTGNRADVLWGVLYRMRSDDRIALDACESLGIGYDEVAVEVIAGERVWRTFLYQAREDMIDAALQPARWYLDHVRTGYREHRLPVAPPRRTR